MSSTRQLGRSELRVPLLGVGAMTWGAPSRLSRLTPAKLAYGGAEGAEEEARAFEASLAAGVTLFDTAAMYSHGASERRLVELAHGTSALIATKFPPGMRSTPRTCRAPSRRVWRGWDARSWTCTCITTRPSGLTSRG